MPVEILIITAEGLKNNKDNGLAISGQFDILSDTAARLKRQLLKPLP